MKLLFVLLVVVFGAVEGCKDTINNCRLYKKYCPQSSFRAWMEERCSKTCGFCDDGPTPPPTPEPACHDKRDDCRSWTKLCTDSDWQGWARTNCARTCKMCGDTDPTDAPTDAPTDDDNPTDGPTDGPTDDSGDLDHFQGQVLARHNELRVRHRVGKASWHAGCAAHAKKWCQHLADTGKFEHSKNSGYGENIYKSWGSGVDSNLGKDVSNSWYSEVNDYNFRQGGYQSGTGHFTQMVWKASTGLGCSYATKGNEVVVCCNYSPQGNWMNRFDDNVFPARN